MTKTIKIITIVDDNPITGPVYGTIEVNNTNSRTAISLKKALRNYEKVAARKSRLIRQENLKHK